MEFLPSSNGVNTTLWMHYMDADKMHTEKAREGLHKNAVSNIEQKLEVTPNKTIAVWPLTFYL